jgi:lipid-binding SYLF domain-containing protein
MTKGQQGAKVFRSRKCPVRGIKKQVDIDMMDLTRRNLLLGAAATLPLAACGNGIDSQGASRIDGRVDSALSFMFNEVRGSEELSYSARGMLVMPLVTEAGFGVGGSYGRGALRINGATVDYYSTAAASFGFQIGAQQFAHTLFFMTEEALSDFRTSTGWGVGADIQYAVSSRGGNLGIDSTTLSSPVIAVVYGQAGLIAGASLEGQRYSRIIP